MRTTWEVWTFDVLGNSRDGFDVNDRCCIVRKYELNLRPKTYNKGTPNEFKAYELSNTQLRSALGLTGYKRGIEVHANDTHYDVELANGRPYGELVCTSHESLHVRKVIPV